MQPSSLPLPPGPPGHLSISSVYAAWRDPIATMTTLLADHGDLVHTRFGPIRYVTVNHPDGVRHVLVENAKNYVKSRNYRGLKLVLGDGLLLSEGETWRRQRKLTQPGFHRERIAGFAATMARDTRDMLDRWDGVAPAGRTLDVHAEMMRLSLRIVGETLFGLDVDGSAGDVGRALAVVVHYANDYAESLVRLPTWLPTRKNREFRRQMGVLDRLVARIVGERRRRGELGDDLLAMLLAARDEETGVGMTETQLRDEVMTLVLAGHETTANALTFTWWLLARHPEVAKRLRDEVDQVLGDRDPTPADLGRMPFCAHVLDESMRLYPPAWAFEREALADDVIQGHRVPKGTTVGIFPFLLHRHTAFWDDPERFDPDRFTAERVAARPKWAYVPFGGGPRTCIGSAFASMEAQIVLAMMARRIDVELVPGERVDLEPTITLRPRAGLRLAVRPRDRALYPPAPASGAEEEKSMSRLPGLGLVTA